MRLIDADKINPADVIGGASEFATDVRKAMQDLIDIQPTAYNLDAVVDQLHKTQVYKFQGKLPDGRICHFSDVIEIVKAGGVHE